MGMGDLSISRLGSSLNSRDCGEADTDRYLAKELMVVVTKGRMAVTGTWASGEVSVPYDFCAGTM